MRETFTSGSVGRAPGNRCLYPEPDCLQRPLRSRCWQQVSASVRLLARKLREGMSYGLPHLAVVLHRCFHAGDSYTVSWLPA
jgi:hypothetical protein